MNKFILILLTILYSNFLNAQDYRKIYTNLKFISPTKASPIFAPGSFDLKIRIYNLGPDNLEIGDTFVINTSRDLNKVNRYSEVFKVRLNKNINKNDSIDYVFNIRLWDTVNNFNYYITTNYYIYRNSLNPIINDPGKTLNEKHKSLVLNLTYDRTVNILNQSFHEFKISPNPFNENLLIKNELNQTFNIEIYDIYGRLVIKNKEILKSEEILLQTDFFESGTYLLKIISETGDFYTKKLIKN